MDDEATFTCAGCRRTYPVGAWRNLRRIRTLRGADVQRHVSAWPDSRVIEVRACERCGRAMARTALVEPAKRGGGDVDDDAGPHPDHRAPRAQAADAAQASLLTFTAAARPRQRSVQAFTFFQAE